MNPNRIALVAALAASMFPFFAKPSFAQEKAWEWLNPHINGNYATNVNLLPHTNSIVISYPEQLLVSEDRGTLWKSIKTGYAVTAVKQCSSSLNFGFTSNGEIVKDILSDSRRVVFQQNGTALQFYDVMIDSVSGFGLAAGGYEVWEPFDGGTMIHNWGLILQTHDFGDHWEKVYEKLGDEIKGIQKRQGMYTAYGTERANFVLESPDGTDWSFKDDYGLGDDVIQFLQFTNNNHGFLHYEDGVNLYFTNNGGATWALKKDFNTAVRSVDVSQNTIAAVSYSKVFISFDGGATWEEKKITPYAPAFTDVSIANDMILVRNNLDALHLAVNYTTTFRDINDNFYYWNMPEDSYIVLGANHTQFVSEAIGYTLLSNSSGFSSLLKTTNGGCSWDKVSEIFWDYHYQFHFIDETHGVKSHSGSIEYTEDGGVTWTRSTEPIDDASFRLIALDFFDASTGIAMTDDKIIRTINGGKSWIEISHPFYPIGNFMDFQIMSSTTAYIAFRNDVYFVTTDAGVTWKSFKTKIAMDWTAVCFVDALNGFMAGDKDVQENGKWITKHVLIRTTNGGTTWSKVMDLPQRANDIKFQTPEIAYLLGQSGMLLKTSNEGATWAPEESIITQSLDNIFFFDNAMYLTGDYYTVAKKSNIPVADFTLTSSTLCQLDSIIVANGSNSASSYLWKLDGEIISTSKNLNHIIDTTPGTHTLELTSGSCNFTNYDQEMQTITVLETPRPELFLNDHLADPFTYLCDSTYTVSTQNFDSYQWSNGTTGSDVLLKNETFLSVKVTLGVCAAQSDTLHFEKLLHPLAAFDAQFDFETGSVHFTNNSENAQEYAWDFKDGATSQEESPDHKFPVHNAFYNVSLIAKNYCWSDTLVQEINPSGITGIEDQGEHSNTVYPNPVHVGDRLMVDGASYVGYAITSVNGLEIIKASIKNATITLPSLSPGVYLITLYDNTGTRTLHRLLVQ